jgi:cytochrome c oxidase assembly factor CtaG
MTRASMVALATLALLAAPLAVTAQPAGKVHRIGFWAWARARAGLS